MQVPKRIYSLEELKLNNVYTGVKLLTLLVQDQTLNNVRLILRLLGLAGVTAAVVGLDWSINQALLVVVFTMFAVVADEVANGGAYEGLLVDTIGRAINRSYGERVACHEAGHFLIAVLLGLLPKGYTLSAADALQKYGLLNVQAGTQFCDSAFQQEVAKGKLSSTSLDKYTCIALAGIAAEYVTLGKSEGGLNDIRQLDGLLKALGFSQQKADGQIRWAVLNITTLLRRHKETHQRLAAAMAEGKSVSDCIAVVEEGTAQVQEI
eukprot:jgi/Astpho2/8146/e_gw1.00120.139.1_t